MSEIKKQALKRAESGEHDRKGLEHFKIWCTGLDRYEDVAYKEDYTAILKYCQ